MRAWRRPQDRQAIQPEVNAFYTSDLVVWQEAFVLHHMEKVPCPWHLANIVSILLWKGSSQTARDIRWDQKLNLWQKHKTLKLPSAPMWTKRRLHKSTTKLLLWNHTFSRKWYLQDMHVWSGVKSFWIIQQNQRRYASWIKTDGWVTTWEWTVLENICVKMKVQINYMYLTCCKVV